MPTGGEKDITPPEVIESNPENHSTNFKNEKNKRDSTQLANT